MIIGIPVLNRRDLLERCLASIDVDAHVVVIDNSSDAICADLPEAVEVVTPSSNLGVAASWNLVIRTHPAEPWWCFLNADTELGAGDLVRIAAATTQPGPQLVGMNGDWRVMALNAACVDLVGFFDEQFHPIYCEDADYEYRCSLADVPWGFIDGAASHLGSAAFRSDERYVEANARTYPANVEYYEAKWGGPVRGGERFTTPFDRGGSVRDWTLELGRIRDLAWP